MKYWVLHKKRLYRQPVTVSKLLRKATLARRRVYPRQIMYLFIKGWLTEEIKRVELAMLYGRLAEHEQAKENTSENSH
jgi:hypothetical protein